METTSRRPKWLTIGNYRIELKRDTEEAEKKLGLAPRELEFLKLLAEGFCLKSTAQFMKISPHTADTYKRRIYEKLGVHSAPEATFVLVAYYAGGNVEEITTAAALPAAA